MTDPDVTVQQIGVDSNHVLHCLGRYRGALSRPYKQVFVEIHFSTFSKRISARWSTGKIPRSFWMTTVRLVATLPNIVPDTHLIVALIKLNHALAGIFMSVCTQIPESAR